MFRLGFDLKRRDPHKVLCLGAHSDDIEIGCGGTILRLLTSYPNLEFYWVVFSGEGERGSEARRSAKLFLKEANRKTILVKNFRTSFFPYSGDDIKEFFESLKAKISPDLIFTHFRADLHQDHRIVNELTWNTFRDHLILEYEIPKYDGDLGSPNLFVPLDDAVVGKKLRHLMQHFASQRDKRWFDEETFRGLLRLRGVEAGERYAEAFYGRKIVL